MFPIARRSVLFGGRWTPKRLGSNLSAWYDASDRSTLFQDASFSTPVTADADPVGGWRDKSGNGRHVTQSTAANQPTYKVAIQNGLPVIRFDGSNDRLVGGNYLGGTSGLTIGLAVKAPSGTAGEWILVKQASNGLNGWRLYGGFVDGQWVFRGGDASNNQIWVAQPTIEAFDGAFHILVCLFQIGEQSIIYDNTLQTPSTGTDPHTVDTSNFTVGSNTNGSSPYNGDIGEVIISTSALSRATRDKMTAYLNRRWGTF